MNILIFLEWIVYEKLIWSKARLIRLIVFCQVLLFLAGNVLFYYRYYNVKEEGKLNALAFIQVHLCGRCLAAEYFSKVTLLKRVIKYGIIFLLFECADYDFLRMKYSWGGFLTGCQSFCFPLLSLQHLWDIL